MEIWNKYGIIVSVDTFEDVNTDRVVFQRMTPEEALKALRYENYTWLLIDVESKMRFPELYAIVKYRCRNQGTRETPNGVIQLYSVLSEEQMYLDMMSEVLQLGNVRPDRTGVGVHSLFGHTLRFNLLDRTLPLLTTKRVFFKGVAKELLWFLKGSTHTQWLQAHGVHIWDGNGTRAFLDNRGLTHYPEGELGPVYGFQWRNWGKEYPSVEGRGIDQIQKIIHTIQTNPFDRRMILSAWNVSQLDSMALPPCHVLAQFYVHEKDNIRFLSCAMYQRSADVFLGVPFNIASYALLTHMIAQVTGTIAYELITHYGDTHLYTNHVEQAKTQIERYYEGKPFCKLRLNPEKKNIDDFVYEDMQIEKYTCCESIKAPMAV